MASEQYENEGSLRAPLEKDLNIKITVGDREEIKEKNEKMKEGSLPAPLKKDLDIKITDEEREEIKEKNEKMKEVFERAKTKLSENSPGFFYSMDTGFVLLINNVNFGCDDKRTGSNEDVKGIQRFFGEILGWQVVPHEDLTASEIEEVVTNISKCKDFPYRALFIFILTHGSEEGVHGVLHKPVKVQSLVDKFKKTDAEKKFWEIPKFFIIQACRGKQEDCAQRDGPDYVDESMQAGCQNQDVTNLVEPTRIILPQMSNFLVAYACLNGYTASRDIIQGSWFIQKFLEIAPQFYKTEDIVSIFSRVNFEVSNIMHQNKQMPIYEVGLRQRCFFTEYFTLVDSGAAPARSMSRLSLENCLTMNKVFIQKLAPEFEAEAVKDGKKQKVKLSDYKGKYVVLFFYQLTPVCLEEIIAFSNRAEEFRKLNCEVIACSVDSHFSLLTWTEQPRKHGGLGEMDIPIVSDLNKQISRDYGVLLEDDGISLSGLFIIDDKGILRQITVNHLRVVRNVDETLRLVQASQSVDRHGESDMEIGPAN